MAEEENIKSARLTPEEAKFLDENKISFTDLVKESLTNVQKKKNKDEKKKLTNKLMTNGIYAIIGLAFLSALNFQSNIYSILLIGGMGAFFALAGGINLYLTIRKIQGDVKIGRK